MIILVRTILNQNGQLTAVEIKTKVENQFKSYQDIKSLKMDKYCDTNYSTVRLTCGQGKIPVSI